MKNTQPVPCELGHEGPFKDREKFDRAGGIWRGMATCQRCLSTVRVPEPKVAA